MKAENEVMWPQPRNTSTYWKFEDEGTDSPFEIPEGVWSY
jgi:hypothetical protein